MESPIQEGYLILADISEYTSFLAENELDHAPAILNNVLTLLVNQMTPTLKLAEVEGDAVFLYLPAAAISRGELLLELIEDCYSAFRDKQRMMQHNATCPCKACRSISQLDLKFITHFGSYVLQHLAGTQKPVGTSVNLAHRLLKNEVAKATGWRGYALFSEPCLSQLGLMLEGLHEQTEHYEHLGAVRTGSFDLDECYEERVAHRRIVLAPEEADISITFDFAEPPPIVWDWLNDPHKRNVWFKGADWTVVERPGGRTGPAAQNHCKNSKATEHVLDWHPFSYATVRLVRGSIDILITDQLEMIGGGTRLCRSMQLQGSWPRWMLRPLMRMLALQLMQVDKAFHTLNQHMVKAKAQEIAYA
ncbi:MAG TPA: DUF2652 domain-containing protein [Rhodothermales bacterium]|nr:DUF2652 domain-containing protein [Rhodothermales bacterium]